MNAQPSKSDKDKIERKPINESPSQNTMIDTNACLAQNQMASNPFASSTEHTSRGRDSFLLHDGNYQITSLGGFSLSSLEGGLSQREKAAFNSRDEVQDFLDRLSNYTNSKDSDDAKPASSTTAGAGAEKTEGNPKKSKTDWEGMFHEAVSKPRSSPMAISQPVNAPEVRDVPMDPVPPTDDSLVPGLFASLVNSKQELSSLNLNSLSDPNWSLGVARGSGVAKDASLQNVFSTATAGEATAQVGTTTPGLNFQQFFNARQKGQFAPDDRKPAAREGTSSPLDASSTHTVAATTEEAGREYVDEITDLDVLLGRGGKANHHPGNQFYLNFVTKTKPQYGKCTLKSEKTRMAQYVVDYIHQERKGRFLELDKDAERWYVVDNKKARTKAGQALRDQNTPESRAKKRAKYGC